MISVIHCDTESSDNHSKFDNPINHSSDVFQSSGKVIHV